MSPVESQTAPELQEAPPLPGLMSSIASVLKLQRKRILVTAASVGVASLLIALLLPTVYTATASFLPPGANNASSMTALLGQLSAVGGGAASLLGGTKSSGDMYVGILKSRLVSSDLVERFDLRKVYREKRESKAEKTLSNHTEFNVGTKDMIVTVSVTERDPQRARDIANGYLDELRATSSNLALTESSQRRQFFEKRLAAEKDELANAEVALKQTQESTGLIAPAGQTASEIQALAQLRAQIAGREVQLASLLHDETEQNPDVLRLRNEIGSLRAQISQRENGAGKSAPGGFSTSQVPALELDIVRRTREVKYHEALFEILAKQYEAARLDEAHEPTLQILDRAVTPDIKSGPHRLLITAAGLCLRSVRGCHLGADSRYPGTATGLEPERVARRIAVCSG